MGGEFQLGSSRETAMPHVGHLKIHVPFKRRRLAVGGSLATIALLIGPGCGPSERENDSFVRSWEASVSASDYQVQPPDALEISSAQAKEIDGEIQTVRQDGKITLRLLG